MQNAMEPMGRIGEKGTLNGRFKSGRVFLKIITDAEAVVKAANVPILTISATISTGNKALSELTRTPTKKVLKYGVRYLR
jgi:hypothetical protein